MKLLAPLKKFILFSRQPRPSVFRVRVRPKLKIGDDFSILSASRLPRCFGTVFASVRYRNYPRVHRSSPPFGCQLLRFSRSPSLEPSCAAPHRLCRLMYLQEPIPIVILGYDLRLRRFDCQISRPFASPTWNVASRRGAAADTAPRSADNPQVGLLRRFLFPFHFFLVISLLSSFGKSSRFLSMPRVDDPLCVC